MIKYGYARVSTEDQHTDTQVQQLLDAGILPENIYKDKITGMTFERENYQKMFSLLKEGDEIYITKTDRLGRSSWRIQEQLEKLNNLKVSVVFLNDGYSTRGKDNLIVKFGTLMAEIDRQNILERTQAGRRRAMANGKRMGRPPMPEEKKNSILDLYYLGYSQREIAQTVGCTRQRVGQILKNIFFKKQEPAN